MLNLACSLKLTSFSFVLCTLLLLQLLISSISIPGCIVVAMHPGEQPLTPAQMARQSWLRDEQIRIAMASQHEQCDIVEYHFEFLLFELPRGDETCTVRCQRKLDQIRRSLESSVLDVMPSREFLDICQASQVITLSMLGVQGLSGLLPTQNHEGSSSNCGRRLDSCQAQALAERMKLKPSCECSLEIEFVALRYEWLKDIFNVASRGRVPQPVAQQLALFPRLCTLDFIKNRLDRTFMDGLITSSANSVRALRTCQEGERTLKGSPASFETLALPSRPLTNGPEPLWVAVQQIKRPWADFLRRLEGGGDTSDLDIPSSALSSMVDLTERNFVVAQRSRLNPVGEAGSRGFIRDHGFTGEPRESQNMCFPGPETLCMTAVDSAPLNAKGLGQWQQQGAQQFGLQMESLEGLADSSFMAFSDGSFMTDIMASTARNDYDGRLIQLRPAEAMSSRQAAQRNDLNENWSKMFKDNPHQKSPFR